MAGKKISELTALGSVFADTDLFEVSDESGGNYTSKKVTGAYMKNTFGLVTGEGGTSMWRIGRDTSTLGYTRIIAAQDVQAGVLSVNANPTEEPTYISTTVTLDHTSRGGWLQRHFCGTANSEYSLEYFTAGSGARTANKRILIDEDSTAGTYGINFYSPGDIVLDADGSVGIGTASPTHDVEINKATGDGEGSAVILAIGRNTSTLGFTRIIAAQDVQAGVFSVNANPTEEPTYISSTVTLDNTGRGGWLQRHFCGASNSEYSLEFFSAGAGNRTASKRLYIDEDSTAGTYGITLDTPGNIFLDPTGYVSIPKRKIALSGDTAGAHDGDVVYFGTGSSTLGLIYHYKSDGSWEVVNADAVSTSDGLLAVALGEDPDVDGMLLRGMVTVNHDPGARGDVLYVQSDNAGTPGHATATAPSASGDCVRIVGYQVNSASDGEIWFNPDNTFIELS